MLKVLDSRRCLRYLWFWLIRSWNWVYLWGGGYLRRWECFLVWDFCVGYSIFRAERRQLWPILSWVWWHLWWFWRWVRLQDCPEDNTQSWFLFCSGRYQWHPWWVGCSHFSRFWVVVWVVWRFYLCRGWVVFLWSWWCWGSCRRCGRVVFCRTCPCRVSARLRSSRGFSCPCVLNKTVLIGMDDHQECPFLSAPMSIRISTPAG